MSLVATVHRHVFGGAYERLARLSAMLCRIGVLLAVLQVLSWTALAWVHDGETAKVIHARHEARMNALDTMVAPSIAVLAKTDRDARAGLPDSFEWSMNGVRETTRCLLWAVGILVLPMVIAAGLLAPFVRGVESSRVLFGVITVLGLLPLAGAEPAPVFFGSMQFPPMPESVLAGLAAPLVAAILLGSAAILVEPGRAMVRDDPAGRAPRISPHDLESIIRRGEHPRTRGIRSSRSRRTVR